MKPHILASLVVAVVVGLVLAAAPGTLGGIPPGEKDAKAVLEKSPRHGEWADLDVPGRNGKLKCYVVYPERKDKAPVVIVIHEIFGLTDWIRGVADQLAADGFIAVAPDLLSGHGTNGGGTETFPDRGSVTRAVMGLNRDEVTAGLNAAREYGMKLPAANGKTASIGFCWGGGQSFAYAAAQPDLNAVVVYYGPPPGAAMSHIKAPVLGMYGQNDARITSTVETTSKEMQRLGKSYTPHVYDGAGHGFLRAQEGDNLKAAEQAWPITIQFLREHTK